MNCILTWKALAEVFMAGIGVGIALAAVILWLVARRREKT